MNDDIQQPNGRPIATAHSNRLQIDQLRRLIYHHINESNKFDLHRAQNTWKPFIQVKRDRGINDVRDKHILSYHTITPCDNINYTWSKAI